MKATCIVGSPNRNGSTAQLVGKAIEGFASQGVVATCRLLHELDINFCKGCRQCEETRECVQNDDMKMLIEEICRADILLLASPSYWGDVTGQMKAFIDRSLPLCNAKTGSTPVPRGKVGVSVALRAGPSQAETQHIIDTFEHYFGHLGIKPAGRIRVEGVECLEDLQSKPDTLEYAFKIGRSIASDVLS